MTISVSPANLEIENQRSSVFPSEEKKSVYGLSPYLAITTKMVLFFGLCLSQPYSLWHIQRKKQLVSFTMLEALVIWVNYDVIFAYCDIQDSIQQPATSDQHTTGKEPKTTS